MNKQDNDRMYAAITQQNKGISSSIPKWNEAKESMDWDKMVNRWLLAAACFLIVTASALICVEVYLKVKNSGVRTTNVLEVKLGGGK